ncbi:Type VI secretion system effector, Hcp1 family [Candidatus Sulfopaludibacter sp. SbA3]|nr:Type VI secretion system effector, Hcp1 family [Candidatus Sulfopaludibacter sp. SbA3]
MPLEIPASNVDIFVKITGVKSGWIKGESEDAKHKGEIDVESYHVGVNQGFNTTGLPTGKRQWKQFIFRMRSQVATPLLLSACSCNEVLKTAVFTCRKAGGKQEEYMIWTLTNCSIADYKTGYVTDDTLIPHDEVSLVFQKIELDYKPQKADGTLGPSVVFVDDFQARV